MGEVAAIEAVLAEVNLCESESGAAQADNLVMLSYVLENPLLCVLKVLCMLVAES